MTKPKSEIDRDKLRTLVGRLKRVDHLTLLDRALGILTDDELAHVVRGRIDVQPLVRKTGRSETGLLTTVRAFHKASLAQAHFDSFDVNSKNCTQMSDGTELWISECERLFKRGLDLAASDVPKSADHVRDAFRLLFDLLRRIDRGDEIVFFADEGGSWQVGVEWLRVLPCHFRCLAASAEPVAYAAEVRGLIRDFAEHDAAKLLAKARSVATPEQRAALPTTTLGGGKG